MGVCGGVESVGEDLYKGWRMAGPGGDAGIEGKARAMGASACAELDANDEVVEPGECDSWPCL